jgi:hypothetical protein
MDLELVREFGVYSLSKKSFLRDPKKIGTFILIKGTKVLGFFKTKADARHAAYSTFKIKGPFLIEHLIGDEPEYSMGGLLREEREITTPVLKK